MKSHIPILMILTTMILFGNDTDRPKRNYFATRIDSLKPEIDGKLDDACWKEAGAWEGDFTQWIPVEGGAPSQRTEIKILYDDIYLYLGYRAWDNEPERIAPYLARRDSWAGDMGGFAFDSYFNHRTAREFAMTSAGAKIDLAHLDNGNEWIWDTAWDGVWEGKTAIEDSAWTAEMRVPFSQLRFPERDDHVWGMHVWRWIERFREESHWQILPRTGQGGVHYFGELHGISGIQMPKRLELMPYMRGKTEHFEKETGNPFADGSRQEGAIGLDGKLGFGSNVTLDFTFNPDFGQVEADPSEVNLSAYETYFGERRPFFVEGRQSILNFASGSEMLYYSRRIGKQPSYTPSKEADEYRRMPENTTILNALKLTGRTTNGWTFGALQSITAIEKAKIVHDGGTRHPVAEPLTNYSLGRVQKEFNQGETVIGAILTGVNRKIDDAMLEFLPVAAYTGGLEFKHQFVNRRYYANVDVMGSTLSGSEQAMIRLQRDTRHYFQRPDADYVTVDSSATRLSGHGGRIEVGKGAGNWIGHVRFGWLSPGLELNDLGYLRETDILNQQALLRYRQTRPVGPFRNFNMSVSQFGEWNYGHDFTHGSLQFSAGWTFRNLYGGSMSVSRVDQALQVRDLRGGPMMMGDKYWNLRVALNSDNRKTLYANTSYVRRRNDHGGSMRDDWSGSLRWRVTNALNVSCQLSNNRIVNDMQYVKTVNYDGVKRYILGHLEQDIISAGFRINWSLTPDLTVQYYGQPFVSAGRYSGYRYITQPRAVNYDDRFQKYANAQIRASCSCGDLYFDEDSDGVTDYSFSRPDFNVKEFLSNFVIRWEYKPGSTFYLVWSQSRNDRINDGAFSSREDLDELFTVPPHNIFLAKMSYWFSF